MTSIYSQRLLAARAGEKFFTTGKPCKYGHYSKRYTSTGGCVTCVSVVVSPKLMPFDGVKTYQSEKLLTLEESTNAERIELRLYLQRCIFEFWRVKRGGQLPAGAQEACEYWSKRDLAYEIEDPRNQSE